MGSGAVGLNALGFYAGERRPIDEAVCGDGAQYIDFLKDDGFTAFRVSDRPVDDMASAAIEECFAKSEVHPGEIDAVLLSTESFWDGGPIAVRNALFEAVVAECGIDHAQIHASWMNECANLPYALALARSLVTAGDARHVLMIVCDRHESGTPRLMANGASMMSDVAAAALIGPRDGPALRHVVTHFAPDVFAAERRNDVQRKTQAMMEALGQFVARIEAVTGRTLADYPVVLTDNLHSMYLDFICDGLGLPHERTLQPSKADFAHGFSLDGLLGLEVLSASGDLPRGTPIAMLNVIPWSYGFVEWEMP